MGLTPKFQQGWTPPCPKVGVMLEVGLWYPRLVWEGWICSQDTQGIPLLLFGAAPSPYT